MKKQKRSVWRKQIISGLLVAAFFVLAGGVPAYALQQPPPLKVGGPGNAPYQCGSGNNAVKVSIDIGCKGAKCVTSNKDGCNALTDAVFAIIRFLSIGVGLVVVASMIWAGIQYTTAGSDPGAVGKAKERIVNNFIALLVYIFSYAILNYVIPKGFFR